MLQCFALSARNIDHIRMAMPDAYRHDATKGVQVSAAMFVPDVLHFPFHQH